MRHESDFAALAPLLPKFLSDVPSFVFLGIYWNSHHHSLHTTPYIDGRILWANLHLLFWLSLIPFVTGRMGENHFVSWPVALYGTVLLLAARAHTLLTWSLIAEHERQSTLAKVLGKDFKGKASIMIYVLAVCLAFVRLWLSCALYVAVAIIWLIADRRIERELVVHSLKRETIWPMGVTRPPKIIEKACRQG